MGESNLAWIFMEEKKYIDAKKYVLIAIRKISKNSKRRKPIIKLLAQINRKLEGKIKHAVNKLGAKRDL
jgi:DNA-directed RNA polymerase subunit E'/Rpb7